MRADRDEGGRHRRRHGRAGLVLGDAANVGSDHTAFMQNEHALLLAFVNSDLNPGARVGVGRNIASGKALIAQRQAVIDAGERSGAPE